MVNDEKNRKFLEGGFFEGTVAIRISRKQCLEYLEKKHGKNYVTYLLIVLMITLSFCSKDNNQLPLPEPTEVKVSDVAYPLSIKKEKVKALDVDYMQLFSWVEDNDHLILYSVNKREDAYEFRLLDAELNESGKYALKRGQGPRELLKPYFVGGTLEEIFIYDGTGRRNVFCDKNFKNCKLTRKALHSEEFIGGFGYSGDSGYFLMADEVPCFFRYIKREKRERQKPKL